MAIKTATPELHERMRKASAVLAAGVRLDKPHLELEGRRQSAKAHIENQILLGRDLLTNEERATMAALLMDFDTQDDYSADALETNAEALHPTPDDFDEDLEGDED